MHAVWTLPEGDVDFSTRWSVIKARFSRQLPVGWRRASHIRRRERGIWQRRFWEHHIRGAEEYADAVQYCHCAPVRHGLVAHPADWPFSSLHRR
jgi:putative transposase